jgi:hypothetical protein
MAIPALVGALAPLLSKVLYWTKRLHFPNDRRIITCIYANGRRKLVKNCCADGTQTNLELNND